MKQFFRFQYNTGELSMIVKDDKETILETAKFLTQKRHYSVAIWTIKLKS